MYYLFHLHTIIAEMEIMYVLFILNNIHSRSEWSPITRLIYKKKTVVTIVHIKINNNTNKK